MKYSDFRKLHWETLLQMSNNGIGSVDACTKLLIAIDAGKIPNLVIADNMLIDIIEQE